MEILSCIEKILGILSSVTTIYIFNSTFIKNKISVSRVGQMSSALNGEQIVLHLTNKGLKNLRITYIDMVIGKEHRFEIYSERTSKEDEKLSCSQNFLEIEPFKTVRVVSRPFSDFMEPISEELKNELEENIIDRNYYFNIDVNDRLKKVGYKKSILRNLTYKYAFKGTKRYGTYIERYEGFIIQKDFKYGVRIYDRKTFEKIKTLIINDRGFVINGSINGINKINERYMIDKKELGKFVERELIDDEIIIEVKDIKLR